MEGEVEDMSMAGGPCFPGREDGKCGVSEKIGDIRKGEDKMG
jgi:hypothetical protein